MVLEGRQKGSHPRKGGSMIEQCMKGLLGKRKRDLENNISTAHTRMAKSPEWHKQLSLLRLKAQLADSAKRLVHEKGFRRINFLNP